MQRILEYLIAVLFESNCELDQQKSYILENDIFFLQCNQKNDLA